MFGCELVDKTKFPDAAAAGTRAFAIMVAIVATIVAAGRVEEVSLAAWCSGHGYATLCIEDGLEPPERRAERARQFTYLIATSASL